MEIPGLPARSGWCCFWRGKTMLFFCISLTCLFYSSAQGNDRPIIGILAQGIIGGKPNRTSYVGASYVKFLEAAGARVVPVMLSQPLEEYKRLFNSINGIILPGGASSVVSSRFQRVSLIFYELAIEAKNRGDHFPIYGTCLGFELLFFLTSEKAKLSPTNTSGVALPLTFTNDFQCKRGAEEVLQSPLHKYGWKRRVCVNGGSIRLPNLWVTVASREKCIRVEEALRSTLSISDQAHLLHGRLLRQ